MPNWVFNGLTVEGSPAEINRLVEQMNKPFKQLHDSWNMESQSMQKKQTTYPNPVFAFYNIYNYINDGVTEYEYLQQPPRDIPFEEQMLFKTNDWYSWNVRNWGTKWDVGVSSDDEYPETYMEGPAENGENLVVYYNFNTAWSPPFPAIAKLSSQYPSLLFTLSYEEETGWGGECEFLRGEQLEGSEYSNKCRDCESEDTLEYCENDCGEICSECHYMGEADLDCVAECKEHKQYLTAEFVPDYRMDQVDV
jgi:hypothetical protein